MIHAWLRSLSEDNVYSLTRAAANSLGEQEGGMSTGPRVPRGLDPNLDHLLAINTVRIGSGSGTHAFRSRSTSTVTCCRRCKRRRPTSSTVCSRG